MVGKIIKKIKRKMTKVSLIFLLFCLDFFDKIYEKKYRVDYYEHQQTFINRMGEISLELKEIEPIERFSYLTREMEGINLLIKNEI